MIYSHYVKRILDIFLAVTFVILFFWVILIIMLAYLVANQKPVFFFQTRIGKNDKPFILWKFRTLSVLHSQSLQDRRFLLGDFLRATNLDELPQIWNILMGEMSFIGPRPLPVEYLPLMSEAQKSRHQTLPGITGWAQVNGRHEISWERKFELDQFYIENISFVLDVKIVIKTMMFLLSFKKDKSLLEGKFKGN